ncbi:MAG: helix-turn-helix transcriptional regulator [Burkholderiaceae bacterium]
MTFKVQKTIINALMRTFNLLSSQSICVELGGRIKRLRLAQNLGQQQLADMTQSSLSSVRRLEAQGQGSLEFVVRVVQALQAVEQLESLFEQPIRSIAQAEREQSLALRRRARVPKAFVKAPV